MPNAYTVTYAADTTTGSWSIPITFGTTSSTSTWSGATGSSWTLTLGTSTSGSTSTWIDLEEMRNASQVYWDNWITANGQTIERDAILGETWEQRVEALMTPEERERIEAERAARHEARCIEQEQQVRVREAAILKAEKLLRSCLTREQEESLDRDRYFEVRGGSTGTRYRIWRGRAINIEELGGNGRPIRRLCFHPNIDCPDADSMLSQKLMLELDEQAALRIANRHRVETREMQGYLDNMVPAARHEELLAELN